MVCRSKQKPLEIKEKSNLTIIVIDVAVKKIRCSIEPKDRISFAKNIGMHATKVAKTNVQ